MVKRAMIGCPKSGKELLDMYFLETRSALLETAATLDRIERAPGGREAMEDPRILKLLKACEIIQKARENRAEQFQLLFSEE